MLLDDVFGDGHLRESGVLLVEIQKPAFENLRGLDAHVDLVAAVGDADRGELGLSLRSPYVGELLDYGVDQGCRCDVVGVGLHHRHVDMVGESEVDFLGEDVDTLFGRHRYRKLLVEFRNVEGGGVGGPIDAALLEHCRNLNVMQGFHIDHNGRGGNRCGSGRGRMRFGELGQTVALRLGALLRRHRGSETIVEILCVEIMRLFERHEEIDAFLCVVVITCERLLESCDSTFAEFLNGDGPLFGSEDRLAALVFCEFGRSYCLQNGL